MKVTLRIEDGEILEMGGPFNDDVIFTEKYAKPRDNYWGPFLDSKSAKAQHREDRRRDGDKEFDYKVFFELVRNADVGIWLEIIDFKTDKVSVKPRGYSQSNLETDLSSAETLTKMIITKRSLLEAKKIWDQKGMSSTKIKFGIGANSSGEPVVFIHPDNNGRYKEVDWPVRVPREDR